MMITQKDDSEASQRLSVDYGPSIEPGPQSRYHFLVDHICSQAKLDSLVKTRFEEVPAL